MQTPRLVVEAFEGEWFSGRRALVYEPVEDLRQIGFRSVISSLRIYKARGYPAGSNWKAIFFERPRFQGARLVLGPGYYPSLRDISYNFDNRIASVRFGSESVVDGPEWGSVPVIVDLFERPHFAGQRTTVIRDEPRLDQRVVGTIGSIRFYKGPDFPPLACRVQLYEQPFFEGVPFPVELSPQDAVVEVPDVTQLSQPLPTRLGSIKIEGWTRASPFSVVVFQDEFDGTRLKEGWVWTDPKEGGNWEERRGWLLIRAEPNQDLWRGANFDAPRLLRPERGDFAIETRLQMTGETNPHGGLLIWYNENAFLRLEKTSPHHAFAGDVRFEAHTGRDEDPLVGRGIGLREAPQLYLRIERTGNLFHGYASANGVDWVSCGTTYVSMGDAVHVGLHALCPGKMPPTLTRFDYFKVLKRPEETPLARTRIATGARPSRQLSRVATIRQLT
ncbi:MAG: hypothetical protein KatS3mg115_1233 [Candidatus Poribacteria bacterium]|nr:MAG: hypothetical protein KatS3mg115_1233 [Candidatus Poribacteria bacterium]